MVMKKAVSGNLSVEVILIMPIIIFSLFAMLYLTLYEYDKVTIQSIADKALMREAQYLTNAVDVETGQLNYVNYMRRSVFYPITFSKEEEEDKLEQIINRNLEKQLCLSDIQSVSSEVSYNKASVVVQAKLTVSSIPVLHYFQNKLIYEIEVCNHAYDPANIARLYDSAISVLDDTKLYETLQTVAGKIDEFNQ